MRYQKVKILAERKADFEKLMTKHPDRYPIIVESFSKKLTITKNKFLLKHNDSFGNLIYTIRQLTTLNKSEALFFFSENNELISPSQLMKHVYDSYHNKEDGFLYIKVNVENTFG